MEVREEQFSEGAAAVTDARGGAGGTWDSALTTGFSY